MLSDEVKRQYLFSILYLTSLFEIPCSLFDIYMFEEIMDLDLIQEQKKDNSTDFQNNLNLSKEFSYSKVNKIIQFLLQLMQKLRACIH